KNVEGLLVKITTEIYELKLSIQSLSARVDKNDIGVISLGVRVAEPGQIDQLMEKIRSVPEVEKVFRGTS
ncbi:MAG: hypothetical protein FWD58_08905, partial [Firmicutes bacterium]|nr:hypothetical protein [Bacillota bacterium]